MDASAMARLKCFAQGRFARDAQAPAQPALVLQAAGKRPEHGLRKAWRQTSAVVRNFDQDAALIARAGVQGDVRLQVGEPL